MTLSVEGLGGGGDDGTGKFDSIVATEAIRRATLISGQREQDAALARRYATDALTPKSQMYRDHGPDRLLAAAQVYATLSTRS